MNYSEKLLNPLWQRRKTEVQIRDKFTCQSCGDTKDTLHVHHHSYVKGGEPWDTPLEELSLQCFVCHRIIEILKKQLPNFKVEMVLKFEDGFAAAIIKKIDENIGGISAYLYTNSEVTFLTAIRSTEVRKMATALENVRKKYNIPEPVE